MNRSLLSNQREGFRNFMAGCLLLFFQRFRSHLWPWGHWGRVGEVLKRGERGTSTISRERLYNPTFLTLLHPLSLFLSLPHSLILPLFLSFFFLSFYFSLPVYLSKPFLIWSEWFSDQNKADRNNGLKLWKGSLSRPFSSHQTMVGSIKISSIRGSFAIRTF